MNLLIEPLFRVTTRQGENNLSLPSLLVALGNDDIVSYRGLQRHQEDAFHIFLSYLSALVLARDGTDIVQQSEMFWREGLRQLAFRDNDCAWTLLVEDVLEPAFMQPPVLHSADSRKFTQCAQTPDELDVLQTAKNHDVKVARSYRGEADCWVYALISLQTMSGFLGRGNYGIARMNGGFASRPCIELVNNPSPGGRWQRAIRKLLTLRVTLLDGAWDYKNGGIALLWLQPWDGKTSLALSSLDPFFIEVSRQVRLVKKDGRLQALAKPTTTTRLHAKEQKGVVGDPWIPVNSGKKEESALTVPVTGFTPDLLHRILFGEEMWSPEMLQPFPEEMSQDCVYYASVLVRGQGTTDGFHSVSIPITKSVMSPLFAPTNRSQLGEISRRGLADAKAMQNRVLKVALFSLLEGGPESVNFDKPEITSWIDQAILRYHQAWSTRFFSWLWRIAETDKKTRRERELDWQWELQSYADAAFQQAILCLPERRGRHYRAKVKARNLFKGCLNKHFKDLKEYRDEHYRANHAQHS